MHAIGNMAPSTPNMGTAQNSSTHADFEAAGRFVDKHLTYDSNFPTLLEMLRVPPLGGASVSGLSENDYPYSSDRRLSRLLHSVKKVPLPSDLLHHFQPESAPGMHLLPEPLFSVPADGVYVLTIKGSDDGRIFMGAKDGSLYELVYQAEDGWFSRKCSKVNHSWSTLSYFLPSFLTLAEDDPVMQIEIDNSRHIVYTLSEKGTVSLYDLGFEGKTTSKVLTMHQNAIINAAVQVVKTVDKANFKNLISVCCVYAKESAHIHLVVVTGAGVRLYYTTSPLNNPTSRPSQLSLLHIRLPPGFAANALTHRPTKVHKALCTQGICVLCASENPESDVIWTVSKDQYPYHQALAESQSVMSVDGFIWALADVTPSVWYSSLSSSQTQTTQPPLLVTQHQQPPRQLVLLSASGAHILTTLRPVDQLHYLLQESGGPEGSAVKEFFAAMTPVQACATALILSMDSNPQSNQVSEWATQALFRYGTSYSIMNPVSANRLPSTTFQSPGPSYSFHPSQVSTPLSGQLTPLLTQVEPSFSPLHNALYLFLARVLRFVWASSLVKEQVVEGKPVLTSIVSSEEVGFLARHVEALLKFIKENQVATQVPVNVSINQSLNVADYSGDAAINERASLLALKSLLVQCLEVLKLWTLITTHNFSVVTSDISKDLKDQLRSITLRDLIISGKEVCRQLIMLLLNRYHGDNASVDAISTRLLEVCPSLYRVEDAKLSKANEIILAAKGCSNKIEKETAFKEAVVLCKQIGHLVNIVGICCHLASGGYYEGIVDLCLSVAKQSDPSDLALHFYKNNQPADDHQGYLTFSTRMECYRVIIDHLTQLAGTSLVSPRSPSIPSRPGPPISSPTLLPTSEASQYADQMVSLIVESSDELAHITLYQWLVDTNRTDQLLTVSSAYLESFLTKGNVSEPMNQLLWRYYERNKDYYKAAKTLFMLADQSGDTPLNVRVEYLSRALMCLSSSAMNTSTSYADFMLHLEEKKDVARIQLMISDALQNQGRSDDVITSLNLSLLDITTLYEKYAEPFQLWECKLAIVNCAGHSEPQLIQHIIQICEIKSVILHPESTAWVVNALHSCGIPVSKLIGYYHRLYKRSDSIWEVNRSPFHLLEVFSHLILMITESPSLIPPNERRVIKEQCLDYVAGYLTDLGTSAETSAAVISSLLRTCQMKLERL